VRLSRLDSTGTYGKPYSPAQAYIYQRNYPLFRMVYMYNREIQRDVSLGLIAYMAGVQGQKIFLNSGLVPVTMPVRLVELTSKQVQQQ
jgi:phosphate transport system substrate-binding protein